MDNMLFVPAGLGDALYIAEHLRQSDVDELVASYGDDVNMSAVLKTAWERSSQCFVGLDDRSTPVMILGVVPIMDGLGSPWLLGTEQMVEARHALIHEMQVYMEMFHEEYPTLLNKVDARQRKTIKWLEYLGFEVGEEVPEGPYDMPFKYFRSVRDV